MGVRFKLSGMGDFSLGDGLTQMLDPKFWDLTKFF